MANKEDQRVFVNVYDMMVPINSYTTLLGFGIFHSGVEIYGNEYAFGGHLSPTSGIYDMKPKDEIALGEEFRIKESIFLGYTQFTKKDVSQLISHLGQEYRGTSYHIFRKNCNHFTKEFSLMLTGKKIPKYINRLATMISFFPFMEKFILKSIELEPPSLEPSPPSPSPSHSGTGDSNKNTNASTNTNNCLLEKVGDNNAGEEGQDGDNVKKKELFVNHDKVRQGSKFIRS